MAIDDNFDKDYGVDTAGTIPGKKLDTDSTNVQNATAYQAIFPIPFGEVMNQLPADFEQSTFIDYGSGKGRALLLASEYPFRKITGIEFSPSLHEVAESNFRNYRSATQKCKSIESLCMDAVEYVPPPEPAIFFFYNPFDGQIMADVASKIDKSLREFPRKAFIVHFWPPENDCVWDGVETLEKFPVSEPTWPWKRQRRVVAVWVTKGSLIAQSDRAR